MPRAPLRFLSLLMLAASLLLVGAGLHYTWATMSTTRIPDTGRFLGALRPLEPPAGVVLPAGIPLQTILVANGDVVSRGETVALVDTAQLAAAVEEARFRLEADRALLRCLGTLARPGGKVLIPQAPVNTPQPFRLLSALRRCEEASAALERIDHDHDSKASRIRTRIAIELQRKSLLVQSARNAERPIADREALTRAALAADTKRSDLTQALDRLEEEHRIALASERLAIAESFSALGESVRVAEGQLRLMERFLATPRLQAPSDGVARSVRSQSAVGALREDTPILRLEVPDPQHFNVQFRLEESTALKIPLGSEVRIQPMGAVLGRLPLTGKVTAYRPSDQVPVPAFEKAGTGELPRTQKRDTAWVEAHVALSEDSLARMADHQKGLAFAGEGTASQITVEVAPASLAELIAASLARLGLPDAQSGFRF